jgi:hypothetical protein
MQAKSGIRRLQPIDNVGIALFVFDVVFPRWQRNRYGVRGIRHRQA